MHVKDIELCLIFRHQQWLEQMLKSVRDSLTCRMYNTQFVIVLNSMNKASTAATRQYAQQLLYHTASSDTCDILIPKHPTSCVPNNNNMPCKKKTIQCKHSCPMLGVHGRLSNFIPLLATHLVGWVKSRKSRISCQHSIWTCCYGRPPENYSAARRGSIVSALHGLFELV